MARRWAPLDGLGTRWRLHIELRRQRGVDGGRGGEHEGVEGRIPLVRGGDGGAGDSRGEEQGSFLGAVGLDRVLSAGDGAGEDSAGSPVSGDGGVVVSQYATDGYRLRIWVPRLGTFYTVLDAIGAGFVNLVSSGREDGSWFVFAFIWPRLASELESDPEQVFLPITVDYIGL